MIRSPGGLAAAWAVASLCYGPTAVAVDAAASDVAFGAVEQRLEVSITAASARFVFPFAVRQDAPVRIVRAHADCHCITIDPVTEYPMPGDRLRLEGSIDAAELSGDFEHRIVLETTSGDRGPQYRELVVRGTVSPALSTSPARPLVQWVRGEAMEPKSITVVPVDPAMVFDLRLEREGAHGQFRVASRPAPNGIAVEVTPAVTSWPPLSEPVAASFLVTYAYGEQRVPKRHRLWAFVAQHAK